MLKMKSKIFFLISCFILASTPAALCITSAPIIYVAGDGSGDFNCDGRDDHVQINQALQFVAENSGYTTVYLKGPFTYIIDDTLLIGSNTIIEGDSSATIKLTSGAGWKAWKPMIKERSPGSHDITIRGFTIDGNRGDQTEGSGHGYYNLIHLTGCQNINVCNMYLTNNDGDGLKTDECSNIKFYDNRIYLLGHDGLYASTCSDVEAYNNTITCRTNSALRMYNTNRVSLHDNVLTSEGSGGAGIEIQKYNHPAMDDIEVYNNTIYKTALAGIWIFGSGSYSISSANVHIHHNQIYDTGTRSSTSVRGGIVSDGFSGLIENNVIDGAYEAGIAQKNVYSPGPSGSGYVLTVRNNIITNTRSGSGVNNELTGTHSFSLWNNCFYGNEAGDYEGLNASSSDIKADPQFADKSNHDYHLKSEYGRWDGSNWVTDSISSPCIDAGYGFSDYSAEPENNGGRINIGAYGNTMYASKSENESARLIDSIPEAAVETGENLNFTVKASNANGDNLTYSVSLPAGANFDVNSGLFNWTPAEGQEGSYSVLFEVSDGKLNDYATANIRVVEKGSPIIDSIPEAEVETGVNLNFTVKASDSDGDNLTYSVSGLPAGANFDVNSGFFNWTPAEGQEGLCSILFEVSDGKLKDSTTANIRVVEKEKSQIVSEKIYDNSLCEVSPGEVFQDKQSIDVGGVSGVGRYRDVMWINLSEYNSSAEVDNATLSLYWYYPESVRPEDTVIEVYRPASAWNQSYVSWNSSDNDVLWNNSGGDWFDKNNTSQGETSYATLTLKGSDLRDNRYHELNVTDLVKEYVSGKYENTGFFIKARNESNNYVAFYSNEAGDENQKPRLTIITSKTAVNPAVNPIVNVTITGATDNRLREYSPKDVFQNKPFIDVGGMSGGRYRDVMWFNLSEYNGSVNINNATLSLYWFYPECVRPEDTVIEVYRPASTWNQNYVSWNKKDEYFSWKNSGGDWYDKNGISQGDTPYATITLKGSDLPDNRYYELDVTDLIKEYASEKYENTGFFIKSRNESKNYVAFYSSDWKNEDQQPKLHIIYS
jgi:uncharacterized membrane protein